MEKHTNCRWALSHSQLASSSEESWYQSQAFPRPITPSRTAITTAALRLATHGGLSPPRSECPRTTRAARVMCRRFVGSTRSRLISTIATRPAASAPWDGTAAGQCSVNHSVGNFLWVSGDGDKQAMDGLPGWSPSIIAVAVGLSCGPEPPIQLGEPRCAFQSSL